MAAISSQDFSKSAIQANRLIVALDHDSSSEAQILTEQLGSNCSFYKIGLGLVATGNGIDLAKSLINQGKNIFIDLKLLDIPATVAKAASAIDELGARFLTVHSQDAALEAAVTSCERTQILAVTMLTSIEPSQGDEKALIDKVVGLAHRAAGIGCAGVVCSPLEAQAVRAALGDDFKIVTPGIRAGKSNDDQSRTASAKDAILAGADHVVVGRPITAAADPVQAFATLQESLS